MENGTIALCYTWEHTEEINQQLTELFAYLLNAVDYQDKKAVEFVKEISSACSKGGALDVRC